MDYLGRLARLIEELELLCGLVATTAYWGTPDTAQWWMPTIEPFCEWPRQGGDMRLLELARVPATALLWAAGIAAVAADRPDLIVKLVTSPLVNHPNERHTPPTAAVLILTPDTTMAGGDSARTLYVDLLRPIFIDHLGLGHDATLTAYERWQYLVAILRADVHLATNRYLTQFRPYLRVEDDMMPVSSQFFAAEFASPGALHPLIAAGLFGGDSGRAMVAMANFDMSYGQSAQQLDNSIHGTGGGFLPSGRHYPGKFDDHDADDA